MRGLCAPNPQRWWVQVRCSGSPPAGCDQNALCTHNTSSWIRAESLMRQALNFSSSGPAEGCVFCWAGGISVCWSSSATGRRSSSRRQLRRAPPPSRPRDPPPPLQPAKSRKSRASCAVASGIPHLSRCRPCSMIHSRSSQTWLWDLTGLSFAELTIAGRERDHVRRL